MIANEDERLHVLLENLGILPYFDFVLTSREVGVDWSVLWHDHLMVIVYPCFVLA